MCEENEDEILRERESLRGNIVLAGDLVTVVTVFYCVSLGAVSSDDGFLMKN